jgi:hypothetical protein
MIPIARHGTMPLICGIVSYLPKVQVSGSCTVISFLDVFQAFYILPIAFISILYRMEGL